MLIAITQKYCQEQANLTPKIAENETAFSIYTFSTTYREITSKVTSNKEMTALKPHHTTEYQDCTPFCGTKNWEQISQIF